MIFNNKKSVSVSEKLYSSIEKYIAAHYVEENDEILDVTLSDEVEEKIEEKCYTEYITVRNFLGKEKVLTRSLDSLINNLDETFSEMLLRLIKERGLKESTVYKKANVDRRHFSKIRKDVNYTPTRKTVIAFAIALELSMDETVDLMKKAGFAFSKSSKFDVIISYFLENKEYDIFLINEVLFKYGQPVLGVS